MSFYKKNVFPYLTRYDAEKVHYVVMNALKIICAIPLMSSILRLIFEKKDTRLERNIFGLHFKNPVGLAAGFDKNGVWTDQLSNLGFGFIEIGTVTPKPQAGNDKPRLFRLKSDEALINRMGFNNNGSIEAANNLRKRKSKVIIGGNI
eukprot:gene37621-60958_t